MRAIVCDAGDGIWTTLSYKFSHKKLHIFKEYLCYPQVTAGKFSAKVHVVSNENSSSNSVVFPSSSETSCQGTE
jgi:hypothetical protein